MSLVGASLAEPAVLALDIGTSSCRSSLYSLTGERVPDVGAQLPYHPATTAEGGAEFDPVGLLDIVCKTIDAISLGSDDGPRLLGVGISTFWHSLMGLDASGAPVSPLYVWMDARSREDAQQLQSELDESRIHARTGCMLHWSYWPAKLRWLRRTQPEVFARADRWVSFGEFLAEQLTGSRVVSVSMASGTGLLDQHACDWDSEMLEAVCLSPGKLSSLVPLKEERAFLQEPYAARWPFLAHVPWLPSIGDGASSNLGAGCTTPARFALMVGTSAAERLVWQTETFAIPEGAWCYRVDEHRIVLGGAFNDGGSLFEWFRQTLHLPSILQEEEALAAMGPDCHGLTVLPFWAGERSTGWAPDARGAIVGLRLHTRPVEILRAALEAIALRFGRLDSELRAAAPEAREVVATGGALLHSPAWLQIMADVLGRPVLASAEPEASSRGAALLTLEALQLLPFPLETIEPAIARVYTPNPEHSEHYRLAGERQQRLYEALVQHG